MGHLKPFEESEIYQIIVSGLMDETWSDWFDGFSISPLGQEQTILVGPIRDQADLHGLLARCRDLGLAIISINRLNAN